MRENCSEPQQRDRRGGQVSHSTATAGKHREPSPKASHYQVRKHTVYFLDEYSLCFCALHCLVSFPSAQIGISDCSAAAASIFTLSIEISLTHHIFHSSLQICNSSKSSFADTRKRSSHRHSPIIVGLAVDVALATKQRRLAVESVLAHAALQTA